MALGGSGNVLGGLLASAVGAPASAGSFFNLVGAVLADWALDHIQVNPGAMVAASGAVSGLGSFTVQGEAVELGNLFADALTIPATATDARDKWIETAQGIIDHFNNFGVADGTGLTSGTPCGGAGTLSFSAPTFVPVLAQRLSVTDVIAAAGLLAFEAQLISHIQTNGTIVAVSLSGAPLSAPTDGAVTGSGSIA